MKVVEKDIIHSLRVRIEESKSKIRKDEEDIVYQKQVLKESAEIIKRLEDGKSKVQDTAEMPKAKRV